MSILWLVLFLVPARILILCAGLGIFIGNFYRKYGTNKPNQIVEEKDEKKRSVIGSVSGDGRKQEDSDKE